MPGYSSEIVSNAWQLHAGDHVSIPITGNGMAASMFQHHAIIEDTCGGNVLKVIHATVPQGNPGSCSGLCSCGSNQGYRVTEDTSDFGKIMESGDMRRYIYGPGECKEPYEVIKRAKEHLGQFNFCALHNNCEHFARMVKTGIKESTQVQKTVTASIVGGAAGVSAYAQSSSAGAHPLTAAISGVTASAVGSYEAANYSAPDTSCMIM